MGNNQNTKSQAPQFTLEELADNINNKKFKKIVVITGAGISTSAGIPDFRSKGTGLYDKLKQKGDFDDPQQIFSIKYFVANHKPFYEICREYMNKEYQPQQAHKFIADLAKRNILLKNITQNIDGLELKAGLPRDLLIQAHGHLESCKCIVCNKVYDTEDFKKAVLKSDDPFLCSCQGKIKPSVVFFGEGLPKEFFQTKDILSEADCVIVMGTSLMVQPFASIVHFVQPTTPVVVFNNEQLQVATSLFVKGDIDQTLTELINKLKPTQ